MKIKMIYKATRLVMMFTQILLIGAIVLVPLAAKAAPSSSSSSPSSSSSSSSSSSPSSSPSPELAGLVSSSGGLTADSVAERAAKVAPSVSVANMSAALARRSVSLGRAAFAPRLDLSASYTRLSEIDLQPFSFGGMQIDLFPQILNNYALRSSVRVPLSDYFFSILPRYRAGKQASQLAQYQAASERQTAAFRGRDAFYSLVAARAQAAVAAEAVTLLEAHLRDLNAFLAAGQTTKADLLAAQAQLADARISVARTAGLDNVYSQKIRQILRLSSGTKIEIGEDVFTAVETVIPAQDALLEEARTRRYELKALHALVSSHRHNAQAARGAGLPSLSLVGNYLYANPNQRIIPADASFKGSWDVGVVLAWSPNDFVSSAVQSDARELDAIRAEGDIAAMEMQLAVEVETARSDLQSALSAIEASKTGLLATTEAWNARRELLAAGEAIASDVLDAQNALLRAQLAQIDAFIAARRAFARIDYLRAESI